MFPFNEIYTHTTFWIILGSECFFFVDFFVDWAKTENMINDAHLSQLKVNCITYCGCMSA